MWFQDVVKASVKTGMVLEARGKGTGHPKMRKAL